MQAPSRREGHSRALPWRRVVLIAVPATVAIAAVTAYVAFGRQGADSAAATLRAAGCTLREHVALDARHVPPTEKVNYNSEPPTSGPHDPQPAVWGAYDEPIGERNAVHNLEHGGVVVNYGPLVPPQQVERLVALYRDDPAGMLLAPRADLGRSVTFSAWTQPEPTADDEEPEGTGLLARCPQVDDAAFEAFRDEFRGKGPERFAVDSLLPGT